MFLFLHPGSGVWSVLGKMQSYLPFGVAICFNGHQWLSRRLAALNLRFGRRDNCFMSSENWDRLQQEADQLDAEAIT